MKLYFRQYGKESPELDAELVWGGVGLFVLLVARLVPGPLIDWYKCPWHAHTGIPCLTCGMTRSYRHLVRLDFAEAFTISPLGAVLAILTVAFVLYALVVVLFRLPRPRLRVESRAARWAFRLGVPLAFLLNWFYLLYHGV